MYFIYTFEDTFESTKADLKLLELGDIDWSLGVSTSILLVISTDNSWRLVLVFKLKENNGNNVFTESLLNATM